MLKAQYEDISQNITKEIEKLVSSVYKNESSNYEDKVKKYIFNNSFKINLASANPINGEDINISYGYYDEFNYKTLPQDEAFKVNVHMNSKAAYDPKDFSMACISRPMDGDWTRYYDLGCHFNFEYFVENLTVVLEIKVNYPNENSVKNLQFKLAPNNSFESFSLKLNSEKRELFQSVKEVCFTVFYENVDITNPKGRFVITNCALEIEE